MTERALGRGEADRRDAESWFRKRGLPLVVRRRLRATGLLRRATPAIVFFVLIEPIVRVLAYVVAQADRLLPGGEDDPLFVIIVLALTVGALVVPPVGGWLVAKWMKRIGPRGKLVITGVVLALAVVVLPAVERAFEIREKFLTPVLINLGGVLVLLLLTYLGAGSILAWAVRVAVRQVGAVGKLASRALPLLLIVVLFSFFAGEIWQMADPHNGMDRARLWYVVAFFGGLGALFLASVVSDEMRQLDKRRRSDDATQLRDRLTGTPFAALIADDHLVAEHPLSRGERANVLLVFFFAQAVQVMFFAWMVFAFFVVFGALAITDPTLAEWVGHPRTAGQLFGIALPVPNELIQVSLFLAAFSGLYFAGAAATDPHYRTSFFEPLVADVRVSLAAREAYLAQWGSEHVREH